MPAETEELDEKAVQTEGEAQEIDALDFPPGVLAPSEVNKQSPAIKFDDTEKNAIKALNKKVAQRDMPARREQIIRVWESRLFDRQFQHLLPRQNGGWELPALGTGYGRGEEEDRSQWEIDIYSSYRKIILLRTHARSSRHSLRSVGSRQRSRYHGQLKCREAQDEDRAR